MKRFLFIVTGAIGSLAAILSITPPQFGGASSSGGGLLGGAKTSTGTSTGSSATSTSNTPSTPAATSTATATSPSPVATAKATSKATTKKKKKKTTKKTVKATTGGTTTTTPATTAPTPVATTPTPTPTPTKTVSSGVSGTFTGASYDAAEPNGRVWGSVSVTIVLKNGKVVSSTGNQSPSSRGPYAFSALDPFFASNQMTLTEIKAMNASSVIAKTLYVGGVTYSSLAYWSSIKSALGKAGI